jgi:hypothetical protein
VLAVPIYLPAVLRGEAPESPVWTDLDKASAAVIVALSALFLYLALLQLTTLRMALLVTASYAFGTSSLSVSSQALWQHGPSQLGIAAALYFLVRGREAERWVGVSGFPLAFAVISRPTDLLLVAPLGIYVLLYHPKQVRRLLAFALPPSHSSSGTMPPTREARSGRRSRFCEGSIGRDDSGKGCPDSSSVQGAACSSTRPSFSFRSSHWPGHGGRAGTLYFGPRAWGPCSSCSCTAGGGLGGVDTPSDRGSWPTSLPCWRSASTHFARD